MEAPQLVGRGRELEELAEFLESDVPAAFILEGEAGIGKTTLWQECVAKAKHSGRTVLVSRPVEAEAALSFAGLGDLILPVADEALAALPPPQRHALEVALLLTDHVDEPHDPRAIGIGLRGALAALAESSPVVVAIDDIQWLDPPTVTALAFATRRLGDARVQLVLSLRTETGAGVAPELERALTDLPVRRLVVKAFDAEEIAHLVLSRYEEPLSRPLLLEVHRSSGGNPFFALELGRALVAHGLRLEPGEPLPVPRGLGDLLRQRLAGLSPASRELLLAVALSSRPNVSLVEMVGEGREALTASLVAGVLETNGDRLRFSHPLLASVVRADAPEQVRQATHLRLAEHAEEESERARHLALGTVEPDEHVAAELESAAEALARRGAPESAARLLERAAWLTPSEHDLSRRRRIARCADTLVTAGDLAAARALLEELVDQLPLGGERARLLRALADTHGDKRRAGALLQQALAESDGDAALEARVHQRLASTWIVRGDLTRSLEHARVAVERAEAAGDDVILATALADVGYVEVALGWGIPAETMRRALELERSIERFPIYVGPSFEYGLMLMWTDELDAARPLLEAELSRSEVLGDEGGRAGVLFHLAELECRAGNWARAEQCAQESASLALQARHEQGRATSFFVRGLVAAYRGDAETARAAASEGLAFAERARDVIFTAQNLGVLGFVELSLGDAGAAHAHLERATELLLRCGVREFSIFPAVQNEIDALVELGVPARAEKLVQLLERHGRRSGRAWALAVGARGRALVTAANGDLDAALECVETALAAHQRLPDPFELGRTLLAAGTIARRAKQKRAARDVLREAAQVFESLDSPLWAERARKEIARIGGRAAAAGDKLSETERMIADLVAEGRSNKEVAAALSLSPKTVEWNLSKVYAKLGVRSRTELASRRR